MSYWNYRLLVHDDDGEDYFAIHEVFYNDDGDPNGWTEAPIDFGGESVESVVEALNHALADIQRLSPLRIEGDKLVKVPYTITLPISPSPISEGEK